MAELPRQSDRPDEFEQLRSGMSAKPRLCECGHPIADHAESGWGPNSVCVEFLGEGEGWYGVCPCVRHGDELFEPAVVRNDLLEPLNELGRSLRSACERVDVAERAYVPAWARGEDADLS